MRTHDLSFKDAVEAIANKTADNAVREDGGVSLHYLEEDNGTVRAVIKEVKGSRKPFDDDDLKHLWRLIGVEDETYVSFFDGVSMLMNGKIIKLESLLDAESGFVVKMNGSKRQLMHYNRTSFLLTDDEMAIPIDALNAMYKPVYDPLDEKYDLIVMYVRDATGGTNAEPLQFHNVTQRVAMKQAYNLPLSVYQKFEVIGVHGIKGNNLEALDWKTGAFTDVRKDWA